MAISYPETPTKITDITDKYIKDFFTDKIRNHELTNDDSIKFSKIVKKCFKDAEKKENIKNKKQSALSVYRKEFAKIYYPNLIKRKGLVSYLENL